MRFNLLMTNAFIGMLRGVDGLPDVFLRHGFQDRAIELRFSLGDGNVVHPELIATSDVLDHCLMFEWKSGKNVEEDQARRYGGVTPLILRRGAALSTKGTATHDVVYVGEEAHADTLSQGLSSAGVAFPLLAKSEDSLELKANTFVCAELSAEFASPVPVPWNEAPTQFVPLDSESERWEVAEAAWPVIIASMLRRDPELELPMLASQIFPTWSILRDSGRKSVLDMLQEVLREAASHEFKGIFAVEGASGVQRDRKVRFLKNPLRIGQRNQKELSDLRQLQRRFVRVLQQKDVRQPSLPFE